MGQPFLVHDLLFGVRDRPMIFFKGVYKNRTRYYYVRITNSVNSVRKFLPRSSISPSCKKDFFSDHSNVTKFGRIATRVSLAA